MPTATTLFSWLFAGYAAVLGFVALSHFETVRLLTSELVQIRSDIHEVELIAERCQTILAEREK